MLVELAKPLTLFLCIVCLYSVFTTALLNPSSDMEQKIYDSLARLMLAAGISLVSGLIFRAAAHKAAGGRVRLTSTLPVQMFLWAAGFMLALFLISWYLQRHCIFYRDIHF
jgi:hypothetical protein